MKLVRPLQINVLFLLACGRAVHIFPLFYYEIDSFSSYYLSRYSHSKQRNNIFSLYLHRLHCKNNTNMNSDNILTCELVNLTRSILLSLYSMQKIVEEYGIMEHLRAGNKEMRVWMGNRIYLECLKASASHFIPW